ncbi:hypothetical protein ACHHYP_14708 [Achlya hypogyna]|uniref:Secreted protein n=1 Tax=Achlya hypogyna TaxID=1202772 RepID=A0A1V9YCL8_ACHHY|nr:hypothetical protein ACHHYP_14708 [Achlya hypogyna]
MKTAIGVIAASIAVTAAADCTASQFAPLLATAKDATGAFALCAGELKLEPAAMVVPGWAPNTAAMIETFEKSANCKAFYADSMKFMGTITPPCNLVAAGLPLTSATFSAIPFEAAVSAMKSAAAANPAPAATTAAIAGASANTTAPEASTAPTKAPATAAATPAPTPKPTPKTRDCKPDEFAGMIGYASEPNESYALCAKDIGANFLDMAVTGWVPSTPEMVEAFAKSTACRGFYITSMSMMVMYQPPCIVHELGLALPTNVLGVIPFDTAVLQMRAYLKNPKPAATTTAPPASSATTVGISAVAGLVAVALLR